MEYTTDDCIIMSSLNKRLSGWSEWWGAGMAGKWEMQVQNVNKRAPEGMLLYIYTYKPTLFVMEIKLRTNSLPPLLLPPAPTVS